MSSAITQLGYEITAPTAPTLAANSTAGSLTADAYTYKVTYVTPFGESAPSSASAGVTPTASTSITVTIPTSADVNVKSRKIYRIAAGDTVYKLVTTVADNTTTSYVDGLADASLGATAPVYSTADAVSQIKGYMYCSKPRLATYAAITAGTTQTQAGATLLTGEYNKVTVGTAADGVLLPLLNASLVGMVVVVKNNDGADSLNVYPNTGQQIDSAGANTAVALAATKTSHYIAASSSAWAQILCA
jgi:hypothetical protein